MKVRWLPILLAASAALVASACAAPATSPSSADGSAAAPPAATTTSALASPAGPRLTEYGATIADWDANHRKDPAASAGTAYNPGAVTYGSRHEDQFVYVFTADTGRVVHFMFQMPRQTPYGVARAAVLGELPPDAKTVWQRTMSVCRQELFSSATLATVLGTPAIGDPSGLVLVEYEAGDPLNVYNAWSDRDVTDATFSLGAAGRFSFVNPQDAPNC
jgi:hypothetical protein